VNILRIVDRSISLETKPSSPSLAIAWIYFKPPIQNTTAQTVLLLSLRFPHKTKPTASTRLTPVRNRDHGLSRKLYRPPSRPSSLPDSGHLPRPRLFQYPSTQVLLLLEGDLFSRGQCGRRVFRDAGVLLQPFGRGSLCGSTDWV
jgi:hypothetical protein